MLGRHYTIGWLRCGAAFCVALFLTFASLLPLAARALSDEGGCCPAKGHACCRKHRTAVGPALVANPCGNTCGCAALAAGHGLTFAVRPFQPFAPAVLAAQARDESVRRIPAAYLAHQLQQRPPPVPQG